MAFLFFRVFIKYASKEPAAWISRRPVPPVCHTSRMTGMISGRREVSFTM
jgi:hypothetical protein